MCMNIRIEKQEWESYSFLSLVRDVSWEGDMEEIINEVCPCQFPSYVQTMHNSCFEATVAPLCHASLVIHKEANLGHLPLFINFLP